MNRRQKIIVSITGIFLVLLILVGLTYGYFITKINGNTNDKSISLITADLELTYNDGNGILTASSNIMPGNELATKTFSVKNDGNATITDYAVILEDFIVKYVNDSGENKAGDTTYLSSPDDFRIVISCESDKSGKNCSGADVPLSSTNDIILTNSIDEDETHNYELTIKYLETGQDQSADMNKSIEGKLNIIDTKNTVDIEGNIVNYDEGDYVQSNSTKRISQIDKNGNYKLVGLELGTHTIRLYDKTGTIEKGSKIIEVVRASESNVNGNVISINDNSRSVDLNIDASTNQFTLSNEVNNFVPFSEGTLAYQLLNKAMNSKTGTIYSSTPLTRPGIDKGGVPLATTQDGGILEEEIRNLDVNYTTDLQWTYATGYEYNTNNSTYKLTGVSKTTDSYANSYNELVGKYIAGGTASKVTGDSVPTSGLAAIFYVVEATQTGIKYRVKTNYLNGSSGEMTLSKTVDDYGSSYYYRGDVKDNYVNFAKMCWRIVRIDGKGNIKLVLDDRQNICNSESHTGYWRLVPSEGIYGYESILDNNNNTVKKLNLLAPDSSITDTTLSKGFKDFEDLRLKDYLSYLTPGDWCYNDKAYADKAGKNPLTDEDKLKLYKENTTFYYDSAVRLYYPTSEKNPTLKCNGKIYNNYSSGEPMYVGTLTADEVVFAGNTVTTGNATAYYLITDWGRLSQSVSMTISPFKFTSESYNELVFGFGIANLGSWYNDKKGSSRPMVSLKPNVSFTGDGTKSNPYEIK